MLYSSFCVKILEVYFYLCNMAKLLRSLIQQLKQYNKSENDIVVIYDNHFYASYKAQ